MEVADTVMHLSDDKSLSLTQRREAQLRKALSASENVRLIKLADAISNASLLPTDWSLERAQSSLNHLENLAGICSVESEELYGTLLKTVRESLSEHSSFIKIREENIDVWLKENKVYYSFQSDNFYYISSFETDYMKVKAGKVSGRFSVYLRAIRLEKLNLDPTKSLSLKASFIVDESGIDDVNESAFELCSGVVYNPTYD